MKTRCPLKFVAWTFWLSLAVAAPTMAQDRAPRLSVDGTWKWSFTMPDGSKVEPRLKLHQDGTRLTGTAQFRPDNDVEIRQGVIQGNQLSFQVVRERDGQTTTTTYRGKVSGETIKGTVESDWAGPKRTYPWEARLGSADVSGTWQWTRYYWDWDVVMTLRLKQEGEKVTGKLRAGTRREIEIKEGKFRNRDLSFNVERDEGGTNIVTRYRGRIEGDTIKGKMEVGREGSGRALDWEAKRVSEDKELNQDP